MKCPYCNGETKHRICDYCDSMLPISTILQYADLKEYQEIENIEGETIASLCSKAIRMLEARGSDEYFARIRNEEGKLKNLHHKYKESLMEVLRIKPDEEVYLGCDTGIIIRGKEGFAFSERGIRCKYSSNSLVDITWEEFAGGGELILEDCEYDLDGIPIAYNFSDKRSQQQFLEFLKNLQLLCKLNYLKL